MAEARRPLIRTPDHRLRVFVSSTLQELLGERQAARAAITRLHLSPVMFELGARPHPPRELYRAYLDQSHIFVGIYWQRYGWVAPDEDISGLEDEYRLCGDRPKLIYVKAPAEAREDRLKALLKAIQTDDHASYKPFTTAEELEGLLVDDLALLLTERFEASGAADAATVVVAEPAAVAADTPPRSPARISWPRVATPLVGRETELTQLAELCAREDVNLITLLGPGGVGKTRLALAAGQDAARSGRAAFVSLSTVTDPTMVVHAVADVLGVGADEGGSLPDRLATALTDQVDLLVLDNFEQLLDAATDVAALLERCPTLTVLVTSRAPLRLLAEHEFGVPELDPAAAVELFVDRARAVRPGFELTGDRRPAIEELTTRLDGLPLAIELAAAQTRMLAPQDLLARLDRRFELLAGGARDAPSRQRTLRATIDWSFQLLEPTEQQVLTQLAVFADGWTLPAAEAVCAVEDEGFDVLHSLAELVGQNLVTAYDVAGEGRFGLLESIRVYARDRLGTGPEAAAVRDRHARYFAGFVDAARTELRGPRVQWWLERLETEHDNLRAALTHVDGSGQHDLLVRLAPGLTYFWWIRGHYAEGRRWLGRTLAVLDPTDHDRGSVLEGLGTLAWVQGDTAAAQEAYGAARDFGEQIGDDTLLGSALGNLGVLALGHDLDAARDLLEEGLRIQRRTNRANLVGTALINLGVLMIDRGEPDAALTYLEEADTIFRGQEDRWSLMTVLINLGTVALVRGEVDRSRARFAEALPTAHELGDSEGVSYGLAGFAAIAAAEGDQRRAVRLWGAADALRTALGAALPANGYGFGGHDAELDRARAALGEPTYGELLAEGAARPVDESIELALGDIPERTRPE